MILGSKNLSWKSLQRTCSIKAILLTDTFSADSDKYRYRCTYTYIFCTANLRDIVQLRNIGMLGYLQWCLLHMYNFLNSFELITVLFYAESCSLGLRWLPSLGLSCAVLTFLVHSPQYYMTYGNGARLLSTCLQQSGYRYCVNEQSIIYDSRQRTKNIWPPNANLRQFIRRRSYLDPS